VKQKLFSRAVDFRSRQRPAVGRAIQTTNVRRPKDEIHGHSESQQGMEAGTLPSDQLLAEMGKFNEELSKAGVLLAGEGLQASSKGAAGQVRRHKTHRD
jgi:hypothetical protein